jgi:hypothetical protein
MWLEIFKTGRHINASGNQRDWTKEDLDTISSQYNPADHEAPVVIGHPTHNAPAYGWVEEIKREGNILMAKIKDLCPEFMEMIKQGLFKKRSIALYPDLSLRHIGFLGAVAPAVKGLADIKFNDGGYTMEFVANMEHPKDPGEELSKKTFAILNDPPRDAQGKPKKLTFSEAFSQAQLENPELTQQYAASLHNRP